MHYYEVSPQAIVSRDNSRLTYHSDSIYEPGHIVVVPLGKSRTAVAVVIRAVSKPEFTTKSILHILEPLALPRSLLRLAEWMSMFYVTHPALVWQSILPRGLGKKRRAKSSLHPHPRRDRTTIVLNSEQQRALETITAASPGTILLHGITGSGKTQIYIELAKETIASGRSVIILVPEIALTSQLIAEFMPHFPDLIVTHSTMTEAKRHLAWQLVLNNDQPVVVLGPRSALFSPIRNLGLIVIDECHEPTYKQEQSPRYSALRAASMLASLHHARLILGSATPSVTDYYLAHQSKRPIVQLSTSARDQTVKPTVTIVDMTKPASFTRHRFLSSHYLTQLQTTLDHKHQSLIFHNRRGSAPLTLCEHCGWNALCRRCIVPLTLHTDKFILRCHLCNAMERVPTCCPACQAATIIHKGIGTKLLHSELSRLFPQARIARFDGDTTGEASLDRQYQSLYDGDIDIIIGTQIVAKGLDLPHLRFVGVVQADTGLALPDYQSSERVFQLLAQVCGRVGRNEHASSVVIQSYQPTHPAITYGTKQDYEGFYRETLDQRRQTLFPPFTHLLKLICVYKTELSAIEQSRALAAQLRPQLPRHVSIIGPAPAFYERTRDTYRWQLIIKSPVRADLVNIVGRIPPTHWQYELDPISLL